MKMKMNINGINNNIYGSAKRKYGAVGAKRSAGFIFAVCLLLGMIIFPVTAMSQSAYMGRLMITGKRMFRVDGALHIRMRVNVSPYAVKGNESLTFTPEIKSGDNSYHFASVIINGSRLEKTEHRADVLQHRIRQNMAHLIYDSEGVRYFIYDSSVPYMSWMNGSSLYIEVETCDCNGHKARRSEDLLRTDTPTERGTEVYTEDSGVKNGSGNGKDDDNNIKVPLGDMVNWVQFITPPEKDYRDITRKGVITLTGKDGRYEFEKTDEKSFNRYICDNIATVIKSICERYGTTFSGARLTYYGCPTGDFRKNMKAGMKRALSLKEFLMYNLGANKNEINVGWISEDWDSISSAVSQSRMLLADAVMDIIRSVKVVDGREDAIKKLNGGLPYYYMRTNIFPSICRASYTLTFNHKDVSLDVAKQMLRHSPGDLTLRELYAVACSYGVGSREFSDIIDLSACLFPDSPEANINAGAVAMLRGETSQARKYLARWQADSRAFENMGVLSLLEGDRSKAEFYFTLAKSAGVAQAATAIKALKM
jgi:hypothetical protein